MSHAIAAPAAPSAGFLTEAIRALFGRVETETPADDGDRRQALLDLADRAPDALGSEAAMHALMTLHPRHF